MDLNYDLNSIWEDYFLDIYNKNKLKDCIKDNKILAYGNGSLFDSVNMILKKQGFFFEDILVTKNNQITSISGKNYDNKLNEYIILICSSYYQEIFDFLISNNYVRNKIRIAYINKDIMAKNMIKKYKLLLPQIREKTKIRILFLVFGISTWKLDSLYLQMRKDEYFEPIILICPYTADAEYSFEERINDLNETYNYFIDKKYNVIYSYKGNAEWVSLDEIKPDIVFFTNPHNITIYEYYWNALYNYLNCYIPYHHEVGSYGDEAQQYNKLFHNIVWKIFSSHKYSHKIFKRLTYTKGKNVFVTGFTAMESLYSKRNKSLKINPWKTNDKRIKIIWAPHHIISEKENNQSNFIRYSEFFTYLANKYKESTTWCFKPHPLLKIKLYNLDTWGKIKTDLYYNEWKIGENTQLDLNEYEDLFLSSDAMIHDSGSFLAEYLYVEKPVLYLLSEEHVGQYFNEFGQKALESCSIAKAEYEIETFIKKLIKKENSISNKHKEFLNLEIKPYFNDILPSEKIINNIKNSIKD